MFQIFQRQSLPHSTHQKVVLLTTGASGKIGTFLRNELAHEYHFRCLDRVRIPHAKDVRVADITNFPAVLKAMRGVDTVIHLAANPSINQSWQDVYKSGIGGTYNVFEAARQAGVKQIIYASMSHVSGYREVQQGQYIMTEQPVRADSLYAVGKACGEALGQFFVDCYDISVVCLHIGWFVPEPQTYNISDDFLAGWCSPRDLAQLVRKILERSHLGFQIFYAVSNNTRRLWDISNAQTILSYEPEDNAENLLHLQV